MGPLRWLQLLAFVGFLLRLQRGLSELPVSCVIRITGERILMITMPNEKDVAHAARGNFGWLQKLDT